MGLINKLVCGVVINVFKISEKDYVKAVSAWTIGLNGRKSDPLQCL
jgi:hypothetical protein